MTSRHTKAHHTLPALAMMTPLRIIDNKRTSHGDIRLFPSLQLNFLPRPSVMTFINKYCCIIPFYSRSLGVRCILTL